VVTFLWMMLVLKIPLVLLFWLVWWSIHEVPEDSTADEGDGGSRVGPDHPRPRRPRSPRRGPHTGALPGAPERTRRLRRQRTPARQRVTAPPR